MAVFALLTPEQLANEQAADALLRELPPDPDRPFYTERQLSRHGGTMVRIDDIPHLITAPPRPLRDELRFLAAVSGIRAEDRAILHLWIDGWSQQEIAGACHLSQQCISLRLRRALRRCYDAAPLSFQTFSYHTVYRPPARPRHPFPVRICVGCGEPFPAGVGEGRYCSIGCREAARRRTNNSPKIPEQR